MWAAGWMIWWITLHSTLCESMDCNITLVRKGISSCIPLSSLTIVFIKLVLVGIKMTVSDSSLNSGNSWDVPTGTPGVEEQHHPRQERFLLPVLHNQQVLPNGRVSWRSDNQSHVALSHGARLKIDLPHGLRWWRTLDCIRNTKIRKRPIFLRWFGSYTDGSHDKLDIHLTNSYDQPSSMSSW